MKLGIKHLFVLLAAVLFALPQNAYSQDAGGEEEEYTEPYQTEIDSLSSLITPTTPDSLLVKYYCEIAKLSSNNDTKIKYATLSMNLCKETDYCLLATNNCSFGEAFRNKGEYKKSLPFFLEYVSNAQKLNDTKLLAWAYHATSYLYDELNNIDSAVHYMNNALELSFRNGDTAFMAICYQDLGIMYGSRALFAESKKYLGKAALLDSLIDNQLQYATDLLFIADIINAQAPDSIQDYFAARNCLIKAARIFESVDSYYKYIAYGTFAKVYIVIAQKNGIRAYADSSHLYYKKAEPFFQISGGKHNYQTFRMIYVEYLVFCKKYNESIGVMKDLEMTFDEETTVEQYEEFHKTFRNIYLAKGDYKNAYYHSEKQHEYARANLNDSTMSVLAEVKAQQAVMMEKIERENAEKLYASEKRQMLIIIFSLIVGLFLVSLLVFYIFRVLKIKKKANAELSVKNNLLAEQKEEIEAQRDTIKAQSDEIQDSINYAQRIQRSLLTPDETIAHIFPDHFLLYKPRNMVSGDYYWIVQFGDNKVCIVADCTGHGVPGGFLSVLGMSNLNHIVGQDIRPDAILNHLRESIITNLRQENDEPTDPSDVAAILESLDRSRDGMDAAAYVVNEKQMKLSFAGANNPLILIRGNEMQVLKADRMPVGIYTRMVPFHCTTIDIQRGDCLYTFSDGFQDQFGYNSDRKFMSKRLRELLLEIHERPMAEQKEILNLTYEEWRGPASNQTDDVLIFGVRI